jgi:hypothetical protein
MMAIKLEVFKILTDLELLSSDDRKYLDVQRTWRLK